MACGSIGPRLKIVCAVLYASLRFSLHSTVHVCHCIEVSLPRLLDFRDSIIIFQSEEMRCTHIPFFGWFTAFEKLISALQIK